MDKVRVFKVDDEERMRDMIIEYVSLEGYIIDEASNGVVVLNLYKKIESISKINGFTLEVQNLK